MYLPVRKLLKFLFLRGVPKRDRTAPPLHEYLDTAPESRRRYSLRWLLIIFIILVCLYIVVYHKITQNTVRQNVFAFIVNRKKVAVKNTGIKFDATKSVAADLHHTEKYIKERNLTPIVTPKTTIVYHNISKARNTTAARLKKNEKDVLKLFTVTNYDLPVCGLTFKRKDEEKQKRIKRTLINNVFPEVQIGGYYFPKKCRSRHKVAILVPYRNRARNLEIFTNFMHPFLIKQQLEYRIFVIEQFDWEPFNRGKLFNIGFTEMMTYNDWHCVVLHDVDFLPQNKEILYTCPTSPRHMVGTVIEKANLSYSEYHTLFGGVAALPVQHYKQLNGFSNLYWGWGAEDDDLYWRILYTRMPMVRYNKTVAQYKSLSHAEQPKNEYRYRLLKFAAARYKHDGLSSLVYKVIWTKYRHLYTHILADVNPLKENITDMYRKMFN